MSFQIRQNGEYKDYNDKLFEFDNKYNLNIKRFGNIINVSKNIQLEMLSPRPIQSIYFEIVEDENAQKIFQQESKQISPIKKIAKFCYKGYFNDIKKLDKNYFIYYYDNNDNESYFFDDKIINKQKDISKKHITVILYTVMPNQNEYEDSSLDLEKENNKRKTKKNISNKIDKKKNNNKNLLNDIINYDENDESHTEINSKNSQIVTKKIYNLRERKKRTIPKENLNYEPLNKKRKIKSNWSSKRKK